MRRNYGIDLLRVLSMCGIVGLHVFGQNTILQNLNHNTISYVLAYSIYILIFSSVNIFAMISGYLYVKKENINKKNIINLLLIVLFYSILITLIFFGFNLYNVRILGYVGIIDSIFPFLAGRYWYILSYILLFIMIPYINIIIKSLQKEQLKKLLLILFLLFSILPTIFQIDFFKLENGYSPFWLMYCYSLGAYFKLYSIDLRKIDCIKIILLNILIELLSNFIIWKFNPNYNIQALLSYVSPFIIINSLCLLSIFTNIKVSNKCIIKILSILSSCAFGVYIIHCHILIIDYMLKDSVKFLTNTNCAVLVCGLIVSIIIIYLICTIIDIVRQKIFKLIKIEKLYSKICRWFV